jgi:putative membrane protein
LSTLENRKVPIVGGYRVHASRFTFLLWGHHLHCRRFRAGEGDDMKTISLSKSIGMALAIFSTAAFTSLAGDKEERGQLSAKDYKFAKEAAAGGMMEVQGGELAQTKGSNPNVKKFGTRMVQDHGKVNQELTSILAQKGATLDTEKKHHGKLADLEKLSGNEFDVAYAKQMVEDHKKDLKEFKKAAEDADDAEIRAFASKTATVISEHLQQANEMLASVSGSTTRTPSGSQ